MNSKKVSLWFKCNKLPLNVNKTCFLHFSNHNPKNIQRIYIIIFIDNLPIIEKKIYQILRSNTWLQLNMDWPLSQGNNICIKGHIGVLYKLKHIWVRILNDVQLAIFRPWALLLHLVRPQLLRNHFFWCRRKEYKQGFQETYTLYTFTHFCTSHGPPNAKKWQKVMFLHFFIFSEPSCKFSSYITDII